MRLLILDFLARRWWLCALLAAITTLQLTGGQALIVTPYLLVALIFDASRGLLRAVRPLPVTRREQSLAWWFLGVWLAPLVTTPANFLGAYLYSRLHIDTKLPAILAIDPWFLAGVLSWLGLGYAALGFLASTALPDRTARSLAETVWQTIFSGLWGVLISGPSLLMSAVPKTPAAVTPFHGVLFAAVPLLVIASYLAAPELARRRLHPLQSPRPVTPAPTKPVTGRVNGLPLLFRVLTLRFAAILVLLLAVQLFVLRLNGRFAPLATHPMIHVLGPHTGAVAVLFTGLVADLVGLRALRTLPLSTRQLGGVLLALAAIFAALGTSLAAGTFALAGAPLPPPAQLLAYACVLLGFNSAGLTAALYLTSGWRLVAVTVAAAAAAVVLGLHLPHPGPLALGGIVLFVVATAALLHGLRHSRAFYQPRRLSGASLTPGSATA